MVATASAALTGAASLVVAAYIGMGAVMVTFTRSLAGQTLGTLLSLYLAGVAAVIALFGWAMAWAAWRLLRGRNGAAAGIAVGQVVAAVAVLLGPVSTVPMTLALVVLAAGAVSSLAVWRGARRRLDRGLIDSLEPVALESGRIRADVPRTGML